MWSHWGIVVVTLIVLSAGEVAQGQGRAKSAQSVKKPVAGVKLDAATKRAEAPKPADDPDEKLIRASAEEFTKLYNAHNSKGLAALLSSKAKKV
jgi:hypothetical protein